MLSKGEIGFLKIMLILMEMDEDIMPPDPERTSAIAELKEFLAELEAE